MTTKSIWRGILAVVAGQLAASGAPLLPWDQTYPYVNDNLLMGVQTSSTSSLMDPGDFKVFVTNSLSRPVYGLGLVITSEKFDAAIGHSAGWTTYPDLPTRSAGSSDPYFSVTLTMKSGIAAGKYPVELKLTSSFSATVNIARIERIDEVTETYAMPLAKSVAIDGSVKGNEWSGAFPCRNFRAYRAVTVGSATDQMAISTHYESLYRLSMDNTYLYVNLLYAYVPYMTFASDTAIIMVAPTQTSAPVSVKFCRNGNVSGSNGTTGVQASFDNARGVDYTTSNIQEARIPLTLLGITASAPFYLNCLRKYSDEQSYWRGNALTFDDPTVFARFQRADSLPVRVRKAPRRSSDAMESPRRFRIAGGSLGSGAMPSSTARSLTSSTVRLYSLEGRMLARCDMNGATGQPASSRTLLAEKARQAGTQALVIDVTP
jgi:hypothetical protein